MVSVIRVCETAYLRFFLFHSVLLAYTRVRVCVCVEHRNGYYATAKLHSNFSRYHLIDFIYSSGARFFGTAHTGAPINCTQVIYWIALFQFNSHCNLLKLKPRWLIVSQFN